MANPVSTAELQKALDNLILDAFPQEIQPGEVTIMMLIEQKGCTYKTARKVIDDWLAAGSVEYVGKRKRNGHSVDAWRVRAEAVSV